MNLPPCFAIIPVRYNSSRFPGKPLAKILGKPMFLHVYQSTSRCPLLQATILATDDQRIADVAKENDVTVVMTDTSHKSGTDRVLEAAQKLDLPEQAVVLNIQGDEPTLQPEMVSQLLDPFMHTDTKVTTLARKITTKETNDPDIVKIVFNEQQRALYFSRAPIPYAREKTNTIFWGHIGLYGYKFSILKKFHSLGPSYLEQIEQLEQLRLLEACIPIQIVKTQYHSFGVDKPEDVKIVEKVLLEGNK